MKKLTGNRWLSAILVSSLCFTFAVASLTSCDNGSSDNDKPKVEYKYGTEYTVNDFARCYSENKKGKSIVFLMDKTLWKVDDKATVYVHGSFNSWTHAGDDTFLMKEADDYYYVSVPSSKLTAFGNSGHPEFKFVIVKDGNDEYQDNFDKDFIPEPYCFHTSDNNLIIIYDGEDIEDIKACSNTAAIWKGLADWVLTDDAEVEKFANFRKVIALYEKYGIKTDICLSEDETKNPQTWAIGTDASKNDDVKDSGKTYTESIPAYYQTLLDAGNVLHMTFTNSEGKEEVMQYKYIYQADYNEKYLNDALQCIIDFVKEDHPAPYDIHCRLGNDRTGYYCAVISGLCGVSWKDIAADYQTSNYTYLGEYRDQRLLKQVFEKQFKIADITNYTGEQVKKAMYDYYTTNDQYKVSKEDLDALVAKFTAK